jgi:hypothetical protein
MSWSRISVLSRYCIALAATTCLTCGRRVRNNIQCLCTQRPQLVPLYISLNGEVVERRRLGITYSDPERRCHRERPRSCLSSTCWSYCDHRWWWYETCQERSCRATWCWSFANSNVRSSLHGAKRRQRVLIVVETETRRRLTHRTEPIPRSQYAIDRHHASSLSVRFETRMEPYKHAVHVDLLLVRLCLTEPRWRSRWVAARSHVLSQRHDVRATLYRRL